MLIHFMFTMQKYTLLNMIRTTLSFLSLLPIVSYCQDQCTDFNARAVYDGDVIGHRITSNGFPDHMYKSYTDECWLISNVNQSGTVRIEFRDFNTEVCCDIVKVYDDSFANENKLIGLLAGRELHILSRMYRSTGNHLFIWFKSDSSDERRGWEACICPSANPSCTCLWFTTTRSPNSWRPWWTSYPFTTTSSPNSWSSWSNSWSSWDSGSSAGSVTGSTGVIVGIVISVVVVLCIVGGICCICCASARRSRRRATTTTTTMTNTTNVPQGTYPVQEGVSYTASSGGTPVTSQPMTIQPNMQPQPIPDSMRVPSYDSALSYPSPTHAAETSESAPPAYPGATERQTASTTESRTPHTDSLDISHSGNSVPPDTSTQEPVSPPPSYDQLYS